MWFGVDFLNPIVINLLDSLQIEGARVVTGALKGTNTVSLLNDLSWVELNVTKRYLM